MGECCDDMFICQGKQRVDLSLSCRLKIDYGRCERGRGEPPFDKYWKQKRREGKEP